MGSFRRGIQIFSSQDINIESRASFYMFVVFIRFLLNLFCSRGQWPLDSSGWAFTELGLDRLMEQSCRSPRCRSLVANHDHEIRAVNENIDPPNRASKKELIRNIRISSAFVLYFFGFYITSFQLFPGVLESLGSSGRLAGTISTYPGTCQCPR